jgi:hypothetical protein
MSASLNNRTITLHGPVQSDWFYISGSRFHAALVKEGNTPGTAVEIKEALDLLVRFDESGWLPCIEGLRLTWPVGDGFEKLQFKYTSGIYAIVEFFAGDIAAGIYLPS